MITQPSTIVTINTSEQRRANNHVLFNALKPGTEKLMKGFKSMKSDTVASEYIRGSQIRKDKAKALKQARYYGKQKARERVKRVAG